MPTLNWIGKETVINHHNEVPIHTLTHDRYRSFGTENEPTGTGNLLIEADNLIFLPTAWKQSYFLRNYDQDRGGYVCPDCKKVFCGPAGFQQLEADHIIPYAHGGRTVWENLTLRCKPCNAMKSDNYSKSHNYLHTR